jgi:hypothetical protein
MDQTHSVFMPGLTRRGPVYNEAGTGDLLGALPTVSPTVKYALMAGLAYLGYRKTIPLYVAAIGAFALWKFLPDAATPSVTPASGAPNATDIANAAAGAGIIVPPDFSSVQMPDVNFPAGSIAGLPAERV